MTSSPAFKKGSIPHIKPEDVPDDYEIVAVGSCAGFPHIYWCTPTKSFSTVGMITSYPKQWKELLLREGKTPEEADAIINGPVRFKT